jgi:hypothetical protein
MGTDMDQSHAIWASAVDELGAKSRQVVRTSQHTEVGTLCISDDMIELTLRKGDLEDILIGGEIGVG